MSDDKLIERLPGNLQIIAERLGLKAAIEISKLFGGTHPYIPKLDDFYREIRDQQIREEYDRNKTTAATLALKHGLTERHIWTILGTEPEAPAPRLPL